MAELAGMVAELAGTVAGCAVIYGDQLFQTKKYQGGYRGKGWHLMRQCGGGEEGVSPPFSSPSSKPYDTSATLAVAPRPVNLHAGASPQ